jgi:hypothetical protein
MSTPPRRREPIPTPARRYWREFRIQYLPWIAFVVLAVTTGFLWESVIVPHHACPRDRSPTANPATVDDAPPSGYPADDAPKSAQLATNLVNGAASAKD